MHAITAARLFELNRPLIIGHRGFCRRAPEDTLPSFRLALEAGVDAVELDYRHSRDDIPVVIHDAELDRTTDAVKRWHRRHVKVRSRTASEIHALDAGRWFAPEFRGAKVPPLGEAIELIVQGAVALVERKAGDPATCLDLLRAKNLVSHVIVQSFDWEFLRCLHELEPELVLGALGPAARLPNGEPPLGVSRKLTPAWLRQAEKTGAKVLVWSRKVSRRLIQRAHRLGFRVWVYTINEPRLTQRLLRAGVDGFITNDPVLIASAFNFRR